MLHLSKTEQHIPASSSSAEQKGQHWKTWSNISNVNKNFSTKKPLQTKQEGKAFQSSRKGQKWDKIEEEMQKMY